MRNFNGDINVTNLLNQKRISNLLQLFRAENQATKTKEASPMQYFIPEVAVVAPNIGW